MIVADCNMKYENCRYSFVEMFIYDPEKKSSFKYPVWPPVDIVVSEWLNNIDKIYTLS